MCGVPRHVIEFYSGEKLYRHPDLAAVFDHPLHANVVALFRHAYPLESPSTGFERLGNGIDAINVVHDVSVYRKPGITTGGSLPLQGRARHSMIFRAFVSSL